MHQGHRFLYNHYIINFRGNVPAHWTMKFCLFIKVHDPIYWSYIQSELNRIWLSVFLLNLDWRIFSLNLNQNWCLSWRCHIKDHLANEFSLFVNFSAFKSLFLFSSESSAPSLSENNSADWDGWNMLGWFWVDRSQLMQILLLSTFLSVYTDAEPTWQCTKSSTCKSNSNICNLPSSTWTWDGPFYTTIVSA